MDPFLDEEPRGGNRFDPMTIVRMFWRRKWLFFVPFVLCLAMAAVAIRTMTPIYESSSQIRVVHELSASDLIEDDFRRIRERDLERQTLSTIWTIVTAPKFLEQVVRQTRLYTGVARLPEGDESLPEVLTPEEMDAVKRYANRLAAKVRVNSDGNQIYRLAVRHTDPREAYVLARVLLDRFIEEERASRIAPRTSTRDFLTRQRATYAEALRAAEDSLANFRQNLVTGTEAGNPINASNLVRAESNLLRLRDDYYDSDVNELARLEQNASAIVGTLPDVDAVMRDTEVAAIVDELSRHIFDGLVSNESGGLGGEAGQARVRLNRACEIRVEQLYPQLGRMDQNRLAQYVYFLAHREAKGRAINQLSRYIADYRSFTTRQPVQSARLADLEEEVENRRDMLENIDREIAQLDINLQARMSEIGYRIEVRRDPVQSRVPVEPDRMKLYFMGFVLSLAIGLGLVVLSILLDRTFTSVEDIESTLGLSVIGTLPVIQDEHFKRRRRLRVLRWMVLVILILGVAAVFLLYVYPRLT